MITFTIYKNTYIHISTHIHKKQINKNGQNKTINQVYTCKHRAHTNIHTNKGQKQKQGKRVKRTAQTKWTLTFNINKQKKQE